MTHKKKLVIIGCGMAGGKLIEELALFDNFKELDITVVGDEKFGNYDRINLSQLLLDLTPKDISIHSKAWLESKGINALLGDRAIGIDREKRQIQLQSGVAVSYDVLVIAVGSQPMVPSAVNARHSGVFTFRTADDATKIKDWLVDRNDVLIAGGGTLGVELADLLNEQGKSVTLVHLMDSLMDCQLSSAAAAVLEARLVRNGIRILKNTGVVALESGDHETVDAVLDNHSVLSVQCAVFCCGIIPNIDLAQTAGLKANKGIEVDSRLQTSVPGIYALGECIEFNGSTFGQIVPIYEQARILSRVLMGKDVQYDNPVDPPVRLKSNEFAIAMGKVEAGEDDRVVTYDNPHSLIYKQLIIRNNTLVGAHLVGEDLNVDALTMYYTTKLPLPNRVEALLFPGVKKPGSCSQTVYWPGTVNVCDCNGITLDDIRVGLDRFGDNIQKIKNHTRAGTQCGTCQNRIEGIIANSYDSIVVGAGLGGLTAAATLAKAGKKVLVVESHDRVGGYAASFTRDGFLFDASLHNFGPMTGITEEIFKQLKLHEKVEYIPYSYFQRIILPKHDFIMPPSLDGFVDYLLEQFPEEKNGIQKALEEMTKIYEGATAVDSMTVEGRPREEISALVSEKYPQFLDMMFTTIGEFLDSCIDNTELKGILASLWWYFGLPPEELASILYSVVGLRYIEHGGGYIKGTAQELSDSLASIVAENKGRILNETRVNKILVTNGKVDGVLTDAGDIFYSDMVLSNAGAMNTFGELVDEDNLKKKYLKKIKRLENSVSAIQLYLGLDCSPKELGITEHSFTVMTSYDHGENFKQIMNGEYHKSLYSCTAYSHIDPNMAPAGKGVISLFSLDHINNWANLSDDAYRKKKEEVTEAILDKAEKQIPGLKRHIVVKELATPITMKRYTNNPDGAIYGPSNIVYQSGLNRLNAETPIVGLYLVGSSIYPGAGYPSVLNSGYQLAKDILQSSKS